MKTLHIHVSSNVPPEILHEYDTEITGVYEAEVDENLSDGLAAWGALQAFHEKIGIKRLEDFSISVFNPETRQYIEQIEPEENQQVAYRFNGFASDELPNIKLRLTLDVTYTPGGMSSQLLMEMLASVVANDIDKGGLTESLPAEVDDRKIAVTEIRDESDPQAIE